MNGSDARINIDGVSVSPHHFIGGRRITSDSSFEVRSPLDWDMKLADVSRGDETTAHLAVSAAVEGYRQWSAMQQSERNDILFTLADLIDENAAQIAKIECLDMAMLHESLRLRLVPRGALNFRNYAEMAAGHEERSWSSKGTINRVIRQSAGPAVVITPWNAPFMLSTWKVAPALAAGNSVILKPAEWAPLSASLLADMINEAGFPDGTFNIVQGFGNEVGAALVSDPRVRRISFTGSPETGRAIGVAAAKNLVPFTAELGGKGPLIVFADADIDAAAKKASAQFEDSGQVCLAGTRLLVEKTIRSEFMERFVDYTAQHRYGDSRNIETTLSAAIHPTHLHKVEGFVQRARANGDRVIFGGERFEEGKLWYKPTLIEPDSNESEVVQREIFGPVLTIQTFDSEDQVIALANSTEYGLSGIIYTSDAARATRVGRAVRAGTVWVNSFLVRDLTAPFGGIGISGIGREGGDYALDFHSDLQTLQILQGSVH
ncbi:MAG: aldehyde dehydrogenase family protein [Acidiferrobacterales bacterium]|nr:aldehyde dehydrogenase family protein [Acidiferrobacterales bacterium]